jgi:hypothetical protein
LPSVKVSGLATTPRQAKESVPTYLLDDFMARVEAILLE